MFINYDAATKKLTINTFRTTSGYANSEVDGLIQDIIEGRTGSCPLYGTKAALEDGYYLSGLCHSYGDKVVQDVVENLHYIIEIHEIHRNNEDN